MHGHMNVKFSDPLSGHFVKEFLSSALWLDIKFPTTCLNYDNANCDNSNIMTTTTTCVQIRTHIHTACSYLSSATYLGK
jgi:hypothetical protein